MLKKIISVVFPKRSITYQSNHLNEPDSPGLLFETELTPSQKPNFISEELEWRPLLAEIKLILDDIVARFPPPASLRYPDDDDYDYECAEATQLRAKYFRDLVSAERAQANAARIAAANQSGKGGAQVALALREWADAIEAAALEIDQSLT